MTNKDIFNKEIEKATNKLEFREIILSSAKFPLGVTSAVSAFLTIAHVQLGNPKAAALSGVICLGCGAAAYISHKAAKKINANIYNMAYSIAISKKQNTL